MAVKSPGELDGDPAALVATVLDEEAKRQAAQAARDADAVVLPDDLLPGVGDEAMPLRQVIGRDGRFAAITFGSDGWTSRNPDAANRAHPSRRGGSCGCR